MSESERSTDRLAGAALMSAAAASLLAMAHHPAGAHSGALGPIVHGAMIVLIALMTFGFAHFSIRRGLDRPLILAGLVAYGVALFGHVAAATINGFAVPSLAASGHAAAGHDVFRLAWALNQALAKLGVFAGATAYALWSLDFLRRSGTEPKLIGLAGLAAALVPAVLLAGGWIAMDVRGAFTVYAVHGAWAALVGLHLIRGGLVPSG
jgi:hypothetical protein